MSSDSLTILEAKHSENKATIVKSVDTPKDSLPNIPSLTDEFDSDNITTLMGKMTDSDIADMNDNPPETLEPETMENVKKYAAEHQEEIMKLFMGRKDTRMAEQTMKNRKTLNGSVSKSKNTKEVILITANRQLKTRNIPAASVQTSAESIIKSNNVVELACSRLATGSLEGKTIKVWCDTTRKGKNRRLSVIMGFPVAGDGLIVMEEGNLSANDFLAAESLLK